MIGTCKTCTNVTSKTTDEHSVPYCALYDFPVAHSYSCGEYELKIEVIQKQPKLQDCLLPLLSPLELNFETLPTDCIAEDTTNNKVLYVQKNGSAFVFPRPTTLQQLQLDLKRCGIKFTVKSSIIKLTEEKETEDAGLE